MNQIMDSELWNRRHFYESLLDTGGLAALLA
jgi:hypothetical protein